MDKTCYLYYYVNEFMHTIFKILFFGIFLIFISQHYMQGWMDGPSSTSPPIEATTAAAGVNPISTYNKSVLSPLRNGMDDNWDRVFASSHAERDARAQASQQDCNSGRSVASAKPKRFALTMLKLEPPTGLNQPARVARRQ